MKYSILYQDKLCAVINKPAGINVYNPPGQHLPNIADWWKDQLRVLQSGWRDTDRPGIVHRLDRDTSGALLLAKNQSALENLQGQFARRSTQKSYIGIVAGKPDKSSGEILSYVSRDKDRHTKRNSHLINFLERNAKKAITKYKIINSLVIPTAPIVIGKKAEESLSKISERDLSATRLRSARDDNKSHVSVVKFIIKTGRTHQIRLHAKMLGTPILGDKDYGTKPSRTLSQKLGVKRQLLHANKLTFTSPDTHQKVCISAPIPDDIDFIASIAKD